MDASRKLKNRRGIAVVYLALLLFALVGIAALTIDVGYFYVVKNQLQNAADAAALAGAANLNGGSLNIAAFDYHSSARRTAWRIACENSAAGKVHVFLVEDSANCSSLPTNDLNNNNDKNGDIVLGSWDKLNGFTPWESTNQIPISAVQVKTNASGLGTFFGNIFNVSQVNISSIAVAKPPSFSMPGIVLCSDSCNLASTGNATLTLDQAKDEPNTVMAFSLLTDDSNQNSNDLRTILENMRAGIPNPNLPSNFCSPNLCIKTTNGANQSVMDELEKCFDDPVFDKNRKEIINGKVTKWTIAVPLVDGSTVCGTSPPAGGCPPSKQGKIEPYHVSSIGLVDIISIFKKTITVTNFRCNGACSNPPIKTGNSGLVYNKPGSP